MQLIGNVLWLILGGWLSSLSFIISGLICCLTIIGIPMGLASFRLAWFALWPFGRELVPAEYVGEKKIAGTGCVNGIWFILFGVWLSIECAIIGIVYCVTIVLLPLGLGSFRLAGAALFPLGKRVVSCEKAKEIRESIRKQVNAGGVK